jgi:outer membrane protein TolC
VTRLFEARAAVAQGLSDARSLAEQIAAAEEAVPALERLADVYRQAAEQRNVDVLSYYAVQNDLAQKRIDLLKLKQQLADTKVALELASGRYLPDAGGPATRPATQEVSR